MPPLKKFLQNQWGDFTASRCMRLLRKMELPEPQEHEWLKTTGDGFMLFHPTAGIVIRGNDASDLTDIPVHFLITPCVGFFKAGEMRLELAVGLNGPATEKETSKLIDLLDEAHICWGDFSARNAGRLPLTSGGYPQGIPAVLDRDARDFTTPFYWKQPSYQKQAHTLRRKLGVSKQETGHYLRGLGELRQSFDKASRREISFKQFWQLCTAKTRPEYGVNEPHQILQQGWLKMPEPELGRKSMNAYLTAQAYRARVLAQP